VTVVAGFRAIAVGFKFSWVSLDVRTEGTVERTDGKMRFTEFLTHAKLRIAAVAIPKRQRDCWKRPRQVVW
jgi:hypothetical protein